MNKFVKRTAALLATAAVFACAGYTVSAAAAEDTAAAAYSQQGSSPAAVSAQASSDTAVLSWIRQSDIKTYSVYTKNKQGSLELLLNTGDDAVCIADLAAKTKYSFAVTGHTDDGEVMLGETDVTTLDVSADAQLDRQTAQKAVSGLKAAAGVDSVTLEWERVQGILSYEISLTDASGKQIPVKTTYGSSAVITGLESDKQYTFEVRGKASAAYTKPAKVSAATQSRKTAAAASDDIGSISIEDITSQAEYDSVTFKWKKVEGVDTYNIYLGDEHSGYRFVTSTGSDTARVTGLAPQTEYTFVIRGQKAGRYTQYSYAPITTLSFEQGRVSGIKAAAEYDSAVLSWNKYIGADSYSVYRKDKNGKLTFVKTVSSNSILLTGLAPQTEHTYAVKANNGKRSSVVSELTFKTLTFEQSKVKGVTAATSTENTLTLKWTLHKDAEAYNIYIVSGGKYVYQTYSRTSSATLTGLKPGTTYTYVIRAQRGSRYTDYSTVTAATLRGDVTIAFEKLNQLGGTGNSGKVKATYGCGGTSVTMLLNEKGMNLNKDDVLKKQYTNGWCAAGCPIPFPYGASSWGSVMSNLADLVRSYGFTPHINTAPEMIDIKRLLNDNKLLLVGLRTASGAHHFQIIYGYYISGGVVYYRVHDPYGNYCVAWAESYLRSRIYAVDTTDYLCRQVRGIMWL